jgi:hypothetical protein
MYLFGSQFWNRNEMKMTKLMINENYNFDSHELYFVLIKEVETTSHKQQRNLRKAGTGHFERLCRRINNETHDFIENMIDGPRYTS